MWSLSLGPTISCTTTGGRRLSVFYWGELADCSPVRARPLEGQHRGPAQKADCSTDRPTVISQGLGGVERIEPNAEAAIDQTVEAEVEPGWARAAVEDAERD